MPTDPSSHLSSSSSSMDEIKRIDMVRQVLDYADQNNIDNANDLVQAYNEMKEKDGADANLLVV